MKFRFILLFISFLSISTVSRAQLINGDLEQWRLKQFRCCGRNVDLPMDWGVPEQSCGLNFNKFVFLETDSHNVHSGIRSAMLFSDTTVINGVGLQPGMLVYGGYQDPLDSSVTIGQPVHHFGYPIDSNPLGMNFWLKMSHDLSDTFSYVYLFTRWDSTTLSRDTLAYASIDIPDTRVPMDQWFSVTDTIHYLHAGNADTVGIIFFGGRFGNPGLYTNTTWIDDISFYYSYQASTGIAEAPAIEEFTVYPNPARSSLHIKSTHQIQGYMLEISDDLGRVLRQATLGSALSTVDVSGLADGCYICRVLDAGERSLYQTRVSIVR